ncbi:MAG: DNA polymerase IV, partial [Thermoanaerobaculia bacterium]|nr:DNA polymerase IV [Thermoanaerobaculia bacterium]
AAANYEARKFGVFSAIPSAQAYRLCPQAVFLAPDFQRYRDESQAIFAIFREHTPLVQPASLDEAYLDVTDHLDPWGSATAVAKEIRRRVRAERDLTVSVGVGPNRLVAKIASDFDKPDGLTVVKPARVLDFLADLGVRKLHGVGPATEKALTGLGITTVRQLRDAPLEALARRFGRYGEVLFRFARGVDERPVRTDRVRKSLGSENTYGQDLVSMERIQEEVQRLCTSISRSLEKRELEARTYTLKVRYDDFETVTRSHSTPLATREVASILAIAALLLPRTEAGKRPVRLLGLTASNLQAEGEDLQLRLF